MRKTEWIKDLIQIAWTFDHGFSGHTATYQELLGLGCSASQAKGLIEYMTELKGERVEDKR